MPIFKKIIEFLESIFNRSSPEVQKKLQRKKMEAELTKYTPQYYNDGKIVANFAEVIRILYVNSKLLDDLFCETICGTDVARQARFRMQLVFTGFSPNEQRDIESLSYEERKREAQEESENGDDRRVYEQQKNRLENIVASLNNDSFKTMDKNLIDIHQFADICHFNYTNILKKFDPNYNFGNLNYSPSYHDIPFTEVGKQIEELYYYTAGFQITNTIANITLALLQLRYGENMTQEQRTKYIDHIKKIASAVNHLLAADHLKAIIQLYKENPTFEPAKISYHESARQEFSTKIQNQFKQDEQRIRSEIKDEKIRVELISLFGQQPLATIAGYTLELTRKLHESYSLAFTEVTPLQILKTFLNIYLSPQVKAVLNDIVVEGFFSNQSFKSDFSSIVYNAIESIDHVMAFEKSFEKGEKNDSSLLEGYMSDSKKDAGFYKQMEKMVSSINHQAEQLVQTETSSLQSLYNILTEILADAKKPSSELIQNLKVLLHSPRNKENTDLLEYQFQNWRLFFEIMSNYTVVSLKERK